MMSAKGAEISALLKEINHELNNKLKCSFKDFDLTLPQINALKILYSHKKLKISELSQKMNLANSTVSGIVDRLEKQGLLERVRSSEDKRIVYLILSPKTEEIKDDIHNTVNDYLASLVSKGSEEEINSVIKGLKTLKVLLHR
ncbi:MarR family winged helix-turn-helix transcriptional regulator [Clostridium polynesiense]|uniref:MarR family winged helix-turn-helix transcriptional regulator n=1 Tax=Clostridium polynesiense TaxID=1325933 RepID=UPI00058B4523|nr:MarR family transcriptional regulator [Clostridium polynesiense]